MQNRGQSLLSLRWLKGQQINHGDTEDKLLPTSHSTSPLFLCLPSPLALPKTKLPAHLCRLPGVLFRGDHALTGAFPSNLLLLRQHVCLSFSLPSFSLYRLWNVPGGEEVGKRCALWKG